MPSATKSGPITWPSIGQMCSCSQVISGRSSATPRSRVIGLWQWALTRPGISTPPGRETTSAAWKRSRACARGSSARMRPPFTATAWSARTAPCGWTGTTQPASISRSQASRSPAADMPSLHPRDVLAGTGVHLDHLVLVDEQRHPHDRTGLQGGRLAATAGGVAAHARVGLDHLELDEVGRRHRDRRAVPKGDHAVLPALEPLGGLADAVLVGLHLLEGFRLHEVPELAVGVQELHVGIDDVGGLERVGRLQGDFLHPAGLDVAVLHAGEGLALARLDVLGVSDHARLAVDDDLHALLDVVHAVAGHAKLLRFSAAA